MLNLKQYNHIWLLDFEFFPTKDLKQYPVCLVAVDLVTNKKIRLWDEELRKIKKAPFDIESNSLFIAYYASAEIACFIELGWEIPVKVIDLFVEFRVLTNGRIGSPISSNLLSALQYFDLPAPSYLYKDEMRDLVLRGAPWSNEEREQILEYCESDVIALKLLLPKFKNLLTHHSLLRGCYMSAVARIENNGIPIDLESLKKIASDWNNIKLELIRRLDQDGLYEGTTFKMKRFEEYLSSKGFNWPRTEKGRLSTSENTFKEMSVVYPEIRKIHELRHGLSKLKLQNLQVGADGRNRTMLSAFRSKTGRNQPSTTKFIFGTSSWTRALIKPEPGKALAYIDWSQQEFGIAAALSEDPKMLQAYDSGDPYLEFAKLAGAVPGDATKATHSKERDLYKQCILATQYGMGAKSLSFRINKSEADAQVLLTMHKNVFSKYWQWIESVGDYAQIYRRIETVFAWPLHVNVSTKPRTIQNFPMQANGAEMLRLACCLSVEKGISVCAPIHDALLIEADIDSLNADIQKTQECMKEASRIVLGGFELNSDVKVIKSPERYIDERGYEMWKTVSDIVGIT